MARILVVEDERIVARDIQNVLERLGHAVSGIASSGDEALRRASESRPDLVLMDIVLPGEMDGVEVAESLRERFHVPVIFLTAYADDATLGRAKLAAPFGYILKPFEDGELRTSIEIALHMHGIEQKLMRSEERYRALYEEWELTFDSMEAPILILDAKGRIVRLNRAARELSGKLPDTQLIGRSADGVGAGEPWRKASELAAAVSRTRAPAHGDVRDEANGKTWYLTADLSPGLAADGERLIVVARDVTPLMKLQESLRRSETLSAMGSLVAGVAHEVRNPLFAISANLDAFEAKFGARGEYTDTVAVLRQETNRLVTLMQDLLDYGRPAVKTRTPDYLHTVLDDAVRACQGLAARSGVELLNQAARDLPPVLMDRKRMVQVFQNLIENAIQHSAAGGRVLIEVEQVAIDRQPWLACSLKDSGPGFQGEDVRRIFEPFFSRRRGGTGLGLSIAQRIVEEHAGVISAANRPEGGAVFTVGLPRLGPGSTAAAGSG